MGLCHSAPPNHIPVDVVGFVSKEASKSAPAGASLQPLWTAFEGCWALQHVPEPSCFPSFIFP